MTITTAIIVLEKRRTWLLQRIAERNEMHMEASYDMGEAAAIATALKYLRLHEGEG